MHTQQQQYTVLFPFGGLGSGARGFLDAAISLDEGRDQPMLTNGVFRSLGGIDFDKMACIDFERLTGSPSWHMDVRHITAAMMRERYGNEAPDVVFASPPCQGASRLLSNKKSKEQKYEDLNQLALTITDTILDAWPDAPPKLYLIENVPGLPARAGAMLKKLRKRLRKSGYVFHASTHDCGVIGGLAQHRKRYLLVARHAATCAPLLYQPPARRVRGVGEVLGALPMPATLAAREWGTLHTMPRLSWRNWLRLACIPAGGDWRDLANVLGDRARREVFRRHAVQAWEQPHPAVTGPGGHSVEAVADPRVATDGAPWNAGAYGVRDWEDPSGTVTGGADHPSRGVFAVADPRALSELELGCAPRSGAYGVVDWDNPSPTIVGAGHVDNRPVAVADPRVAIAEASDLHRNKHAVVGWDQAAPTIITKLQPSAGSPAVADIRVTRAFDAGYGVLGWEEPARTVAATTAVGCGAYAVADARTGWAEDVRFFTLDQAMALELDPAKPPPFTPVIIAEDGTWHRPMTLLELAALQGLPMHVDGKPLALSGTRTQIATHVGNAVPVGAARAIAERMLFTLLHSSSGTWSLGGGDTPVWVEPATTAMMDGSFMHASVC